MKKKIPIFPMIIFLACLNFFLFMTLESTNAEEKKVDYKCSITITNKNTWGNFAYATGKCKEHFKGFYVDGQFTIDGSWTGVTYNGHKIYRHLPIDIGNGYPFVELTVNTKVVHDTKSSTVNKTMYVTANALNVRASASTKAKVITTIKKNTAVKVTEQKGTWYKITVNKKTGWVSSKYLTTKKPVTSKTMYIKENTPLKEKASSKAKTLVNAKKGAAITVYSTTSGNYYKAKIENKTGWILKSKVSDTKKVTTTVKETIKFKTIQRYDPTLEKGKTKVVQQGKNGVLTKTIEKTYKNGKLVSTKTLSSKVTTKAINKIVKVGTK